MSYDVYLSIDAGAGLVGLPFDWNYTSNVAPMWRKAMPETDGLAGLHQMQAREAATHLEVGIARMEADHDTYRALNPENGWGDFEGQLDQLKRLLAECRRVPDAIVGICR